MAESSHRKLERLLGDFKVQQGFPRNAEMKLKDLDEQDYFRFLERLGALSSQMRRHKARKYAPNNSFKPSPLRGLGAGAKIVPTPRPLSGPA